jgi:hypothetical protein
MVMMDVYFLCTHSSGLVWIVEILICVCSPDLVLIPHVSCNSDIDVVLQQLVHVHVLYRKSSIQV